MIAKKISIGAIIVVGAVIADHCSVRRQRGRTRVLQSRVSCCRGKVSRRSSRRREIGRKGEEKDGTRVKLTRVPW